MSVFDPTPCDLGEGPLWHPLRKQLFWFDINGCRLHSRMNGATLTWQFAEHVSAAGWVDESCLLIASETALFTFDLDSGTQTTICPLEPDNPATRSNDGRADPQGGFWIGTMGKQAEPETGAIYRYHRGVLRQLWDGMTIPNAICFAPDGRSAYFTDTPTGKIWRQALDPDGWPDMDRELFLDLPGTQFSPDGAVVDTRSDIWIAQYAFGRVTRHGAYGALKETYDLPAARATCPAFGGPDLSTLYVTTARQKLDAPGQLDGAVFTLPTDTHGQREHQVIV